MYRHLHQYHTLRMICVCIAFAVRILLCVIQIEIATMTMIKDLQMYAKGRNDCMPLDQIHCLNFDSHIQH